MLTKKALEKQLKVHPLVVPRIKTLILAEHLNPDFRNPHITGGFLRNIALDKEPRDCDVIFQGKQLNQPGILEAVREAEEKLGIDPYPEWEFENSTATGLTGNFYEDNVGRSSHHTDFMTQIMLDTYGKLYVGGPKTLEDLDKRVYDFNFSGIEIWAIHRGQGRSYRSCIVGDMTRGLYMCQALDLTPSMTVTFLLESYDLFFAQLNPKDQEARVRYWLTKTKGDPKYQEILDKYKIKSLKTT